MNNLLKQLMRYIIVGIIVVCIDFGSYKFLINIFDFDVSISKRFSYIIGALFSFFLNKTITFKSCTVKLEEPLLFIIVYFIGFVSNSFVHDILINYFKGNIPFYVSTLSSIMINYLGQKFIVFKK